MRLLLVGGTTVEHWLRFRNKSANTSTRYIKKRRSILNEISRFNYRFGFWTPKRKIRQFSPEPPFQFSYTCCIYVVDWWLISFRNWPFIPFVLRFDYCSPIIANFTRLRCVFINYFSHPNHMFPKTIRKFVLSNLKYLLYRNSYVGKTEQILVYVL